MQLLLLYNQFANKDDIRAKVIIIIFVKFGVNCQGFVKLSLFSADTLLFLVLSKYGVR